jgi:hypothetical protein
VGEYLNTAPTIFGSVNVASRHKVVAARLLNILISSIPWISFNWTSSRGASWHVQNQRLARMREKSPPITAVRKSDLE